jgi:Lon-like protease BrxL-like, ATPase domain
VHFGGALSGRDQNAVNKTISGLLKLIYPDPSQAVTDEDLEWAVRLGLELRRRVKEQQKRIGSAEFRNTQFSYVAAINRLSHRADCREGPRPKGRGRERNAPLSNQSLAITTAHCDGRFVCRQVKDVYLSAMPDNRVLTLGHRSQGTLRAVSRLLLSDVAPLLRLSSQRVSPSVMGSKL